MKTTSANNFWSEIGDKSRESVNRWTRYNQAIRALHQRTGRGGMEILPNAAYIARLTKLRDSDRTRATHAVGTRDAPRTLPKTAAWLVNFH